MNKEDFFKEYKSISNVEIYNTFEEIENKTEFIVVNGELFCRKWSDE